MLITLFLLKPIDLCDDNKTELLANISDGIFETVLYSPIISTHSHPGQFINILPKSNWEHVMRRPMSIASQGNDEISIIYKPIGDGTRIMKNWKISGVYFLWGI